MDKLLSVNRVKDAIRSSVNLDYLAPMLLKHGLLTPLEFEHLCDRTFAESERIDYLIDKVLIRKGDHVDKFTQSLKEENQHTGHKDILQVVEEVIKLSMLKKRELEYEADGSKRPRMNQSNGINGIINAVSDFTGRESIVQQLLEQVKDNSVQVHCICGMPAVGKSQLAMFVGLEMQKSFGYALIYHNYMDKKEFDDGLFADAGDHHCLILDNIDGLLCNSQYWSALMALLYQTLAHYNTMKVITTSCKLYKDGHVTVKEWRIPPFSNATSILYLSSKLGKCPDRDFKPVVKACAGVPLALKCAVENIQDCTFDIDDFCDSNEILDLLEVASYGSSNQVVNRFEKSFSLLNEGHQKILKEIANDTNKLQDVDSKIKRLLYNSGWLESFNEHMGACAMNDLLHLFLIRIS
ncbi:uncharacterized protein [Dysidea avara]|uniref:uncharacterized protein n=1 Tax=Dysidea avara TaxID=196820 RepID=UPI00332E56AC